ncbi:universal stress protein [Halosimplex salinum]|uniref:universal stress protein n=1 Tax=Halosimplex salinum TaxID=1710538 RepID=UPI000F47FBAF|nr:universal stress protein [Halosimplex salinum]
MFDTVVIATDGSESASRAVDVALDFADKFDADVHALYVVDRGDVAASPDELRKELVDALEAAAQEALDDVRDRSDRSVTTAVRNGRPGKEIPQYAEEVDADAVALGTRGRHGDHGFVLGSVADAVVRRCDRPVLTVRQLDDAEAESLA